MKSLLRTVTAPFRPDEHSRRIAAAQLGERHTRLHLILAAVMCLTMSLGTLYLSELVMRIIPWNVLYDTHRALYTLLDVFYYLFDTAIVLLLILPLVFGTARIFYAASQGKRMALSELFSPFQSRRSHRRAMLVMLTLTLPRLIALFIVRGLWMGADGRPWGIRLLLYALAILFFIAVSLLLTLDDMVLPLALENESLGLRALWRMSFARCFGRMLCLWRFKLGYLGWAFLGLASLGTVWIGHTLPLYALAHAAYINEMSSSPEKSIAPSGKSI